MGEIVLEFPKHINCRMPYHDILRTNHTYPAYVFVLSLARTIFLDNGDSMFQTFEQAKNYVVEQGVQVVDLKFCDLWGRWHHLTIPANQFDSKLMDEGIGFDGSRWG